MKAIEKKSITCQLPSELISRLNKYCECARQSKTAVMEMALSKFLNENFDKMQAFQNEVCGGDVS